MASRLDAAAGAAASSMSYSISAGSNRVLVAAVCQEGTTLGAPTCTWGGQSMTNIGDLEINPGSTSLRVTLFWLSNAGISAGSGTTLQASNVASQVMIHAASYQGAAQTTPTNVDTDSTNASTPNPLTELDITTTGNDSIVVAAVANGNLASATWAAPLTEGSEQAASSSESTYGDDEVPTASAIAIEVTWSSQNRAVGVAAEILNGADPRNWIIGGGFGGPGGIIG